MSPHLFFLRIQLVQKKDWSIALFITGACQCQLQHHVHEGKNPATGAYSANIWACTVSNSTKHGQRIENFGDLVYAGEDKGGTRGAAGVREEHTRAGSVVAAWKIGWQSRWQKYSCAHIWVLEEVGWQLAIDAKLFWQTVGVYFFLFC
jgi:hypothetical protein